MLYGNHGGVVHDGIVHDGVIHDGEYIVEGVQTPTPTASGVRKIAPANKPYKPERSRKIFNPRPRVATGDNRSVGY